VIVSNNPIKDCSFDSGFENVEFEEGDQPHLPCDSSKNFLLSPSAFSLEKHELRLSMPTLITQINQSRSRHQPKPFEDSRSQKQIINMEIDAGDFEEEKHHRMPH
jgi:hypothetical protein